MEFPPAIEIRNLETRLQDQWIHHNLQLDIVRGEIMGIAGGSGSGKSLLLRILLGLHKPQKGEIRALGLPLPEGLQQLRSQWGVQFQTGALFSSLTVGENIQLPLKEWMAFPPEILDEITQLKLQLVGLTAQDAFKYPSQLSGGMVKRASLARALALDPPLLFLDEPTAGLDPLSSQAYEDLLRHLKEALNLTVVMITHDLHSLEYLVDRITVLVDHQAIVGTLEALLKHPHPWIQSYFETLRPRHCSAED
jgi:phospholipid/cholesterol/gamma-HCH transport system ATP-binding protein